MSEEAQQRADVWLFRARFAKTRADAARMIAEGRVRLLRNGASRALDKPSAQVAVGDVLLITARASLRSLKVAALPARRGPPAEARGVYELAESAP